MQDESVLGQTDVGSKQIDEFSYVESVFVAVQLQIDVELDIAEREISGLIVFDIGDNVGEIYRIRRSDIRLVDHPVEHFAVNVVVRIVVFRYELHACNDRLIYRLVVLRIGIHINFKLRNVAVQPVEQRSKIEVDAYQRADIEHADQRIDTADQRIQLDLKLIGFVDDPVVGKSLRCGIIRRIEQQVDERTGYIYASDFVLEHIEKFVHVEIYQQIAEERNYVIGFDVAEMHKRIAVAEVHIHIVSDKVDRERRLIQHGHPEHEFVLSADIEVTLHIYLRGAAVCSHSRLQIEGSRLLRIGQQIENGFERALSVLVLFYVLVLLISLVFHPFSVKRKVFSDVVRERHRVTDQTAAGVPTGENHAALCRNGQFFDPRTNHFFYRRTAVRNELHGKAAFAARRPSCIERRVLFKNVRIGDGILVTRIEIPSEESISFPFRCRRRKFKLRHRLGRIVRTRADERKRKLLQILGVQSDIRFQRHRESRLVLQFRIGIPIVKLVAVFSRSYGRDFQIRKIADFCFVAEIKRYGVGFFFGRTAYHRNENQCEDNN